MSDYDETPPLIASAEWEPHRIMVTAEPWTSIGTDLDFAMAEAKLRIAALEAENVMLRSSEDARIAELQAEVAKLREALERIECAESYHETHLWRIAREALA